MVVENTRGDGSEDETHTGLRASSLKAMRLGAHSGMRAEQEVQRPLLDGRDQLGKEEIKVEKNIVIFYALFPLQNSDCCTPVGSSTNLLVP